MVGRRDALGIGRRLAIVGTTGSGKTTLARQLALSLQLPHVELDALYWDAGWTAAPTTTFRERVSEALCGDSWIVDGNYSKARDIIWSRAETVIWLDYPLYLIMWQLLRRGMRRAATGEELWNGNRETFRSVFFSRDTLFVWALKTYRRHRRQYPELSRLPKFAHLSLIRLRSPRQTATWVERVANKI